MIALALLALACGGKDDSGDSADTATDYGPTFHGQAWLVEPWVEGLDACVDGDTEIPLQACWVCVELGDEGAVAWWGWEAAGGLPWPATGWVDLGPWALDGKAPDDAVYAVGGTRWSVADYSNAEPWTQTGSLSIDGGERVAIWQGTLANPSGVCAAR